MLVGYCYLVGVVFMILQVDVKVITEAKGSPFYRDHLPLVGEDIQVNCMYCSVFYIHHFSSLSSPLSVPVRFLKDIIKLVIMSVLTLIQKLSGFYNKVMEDGLME